MDDNNDGFVDGLTKYHIFDSGKSIVLANSYGTTYSDASRSHWDAVAATKNGSGFQVLLDGAASHEGSFLSLGHQCCSGVITKARLENSCTSTEPVGWETKFNSDLNDDGSTTVSICVKDDNNDGFVDGLTKYHIFDSGLSQSSQLPTATAPPTPMHQGRTGMPWRLPRTVLVSKSSLMVLPHMKASSISGTPTPQPITKGSGWKTAAQATELGWKPNSTQISMVMALSLKSTNKICSDQKVPIS